MRTHAILLIFTLAVGGCAARKTSTTPDPAAGPPEPEQMSPGSDTSGTLPATVGAWTRDGEVLAITDAQGLFDYMNGGGELYLAYRFVDLEVVRYTTPDGPDIVVESYRMKTNDDAYGLLSWDWSGQAWGLGPLRAESRRALYEGGLLRAAVGDRFTRMLAMEDTEATRAALRELGTAWVVAESPSATTPRLIKGLPATLGEGPRQLTLRPDRTVFLRSPLVLNEAYFVAWDNILQLEHGVDAVHTVYRADLAAKAYQVHAVLLRYPDEAAAQQALASFREAYLAEPLQRTVVAKDRCEVLQIEDGWTGFQRHGEMLALVFEALDAEEARRVLHGLTGEEVDDVE